MNTRTLAAHMRTMPMLKTLAPFIAGIAAAEYYVLPLWFTGTCLIVCGVTAAIFEKGRTLYLIAMLAAAGSAAGELSRKSCAFPYGERAEYRIGITETPYMKDGRIVAESRIEAWRTADGLWQPASAGVRISADASLRIERNDILLCNTKLYPFKGDYRRLMEHRGYAGTMRLWQANTIPCGKQQSAGIASLSVSMHEAAAERLGRLKMDGDRMAVCKAMATGDRSRITQEMRKDYSRSGTSHVLAVSGLHVGIVFMLANALLWWLPILRRGHIVRNAAVVVLVWIYALTAGLSPSVVRSAMMFSALQFSLADTAGYRSLNILAATAFIMLLWNANNLYDPSFQLSFIAVAGIIVWGVPLCRKLQSRSRAVNVVTSLTVVGLTASLATAPMVSHLFGVIPLAGVLISPVVILLANVIVAVSVVWIVMPIPFAAPPIQTILGFAAGAQNTIAEAISALPWAAADMRLGAWQTAAIYGVMIAATLAAWSVERKKRVTLLPQI